MKKTHIFRENALDLIVKRAAGIPRRLNILCDNALITGLGYQQNPITPKIAREVIGDVDKEPRQRGWWRWLPTAAGILLVIASTTWVTSTSFDKGTIHTRKISLFETPGGADQDMTDVKERAIDTVSKVIGSSSFSEPHKPQTVAIQHPIHKNAIISEETSRSVTDRQTRTTLQEDTFAPKSQNIVQQNEPNEHEITLTTPTSRDTNTPGVDTHLNDDNVVHSLTVKAQHVPGVASNDRRRDIQEPTTDQKSLSRGKPQTRIVRRGDTLAKLMKETYGTAAPKLLRLLLKHNPGIKHVRKIFPGQKVTFPPLHDLTKGRVNATVTSGKTKTEHVKHNMASSNIILTQSSAKTLPDETLPGHSSTKPLATYTIQEGDNFKGLLKRIYGSAGPERIRQVLMYNPHITSVKEIFPGQQVIFPDLAQSRTKGIPEKTTRQ